MSEGKIVGILGNELLMVINLCGFSVIRPVKWTSAINIIKGEKIMDFDAILVKVEDFFAFVSGVINAFMETLSNLFTPAA